MAQPVLGQIEFFAFDFVPRGWMACAGQIKPSLVVLGYRLVKQRALRVARVVEFGFGDGWHKYCSNKQ